MNTAIYNSVVGNIRIDYDGNTVTLLKRVDSTDGCTDCKTPFTDSVFSEISEYLNGSRSSFTFSFKLNGTDFQKKVWAALCDIPYGETRSYKDIAVAIGNEKASRAVGMANNKNPINIVVPCHRVIGANGKLVGYAGGVSMKEYLLKLEDENK